MNMIKIKIGLKVKSLSYHCKLEEFSHDYTFSNLEFIEHLF